MVWATTTAAAPGLITAAGTTPTSPNPNDPNQSVVCSENTLIDSFFQQDAIKLQRENDRLKAELDPLRTRFEKSLQLIARLQDKIERLEGVVGPNVVIGGGGGGGNK